MSPPALNLPTTIMAMWLNPRVAKSSLSHEQLRESRYSEGGKAIKLTASFFLNRNDCLKLA